MTWPVNRTTDNQTFVRRRPFHGNLLDASIMEPLRLVCRRASMSELAIFRSFRFFPKRHAVSKDHASSTLTAPLKVCMPIALPRHPHLKSARHNARLQFIG